MTNILGIDVSFWQDANSTPQRIDWAKAKAAGAMFAFIRCGQNTWFDEDFGYNWRESKAAGIPRGAYWYLDNRSGGAGQAQRFFDHVSITGDTGDLPMVMDFEQRQEGLTPATAQMRLKNALTKLESLDNRPPILYTGPSYWREEFGSPEPTWLHYPLWIANYTTAANPSVPMPWPTWTFWQYTDRGDGLAYGMESRGLDMDWYQLGQGFDNVLVPPPPVLTLEERVAMLEITQRVQDERITRLEQIAGI